MTESRRLLQHFVAAIAYRTQKALREAPAGFADFRAGPNVRTPHELLWHMARVAGYARTMLRGGEFKPPAEPTFAAEIVRFHATLTALHADFADATLTAAISDAQFLQGPLADVMTHAGQLAMLRRLAGAAGGLHPCRCPDGPRRARPTTARVARRRMVAGATSHGGPAARRGLDLSEHDSR